MEYPYTKKVDVVDDYHGTKVADPYRWLEDTNSEETQAWLGQQVELTKSFFSTLPMKKSLTDLISKSLQFDKYVIAGFPPKVGSKIFFEKDSGFDQSSKLIIFDCVTNKEELLFDPMEYSKDVFASSFVAGISHDSKYCVVAINKSGSDWRELRVLETATKKLLPESINWTKGQTEFYKDGFFYVQHNQPEKGKDVDGEQTNLVLKYHRLFTDVGQDEIVFDESDTLLDLESPSVKTGFMYCDIHAEQYLVVGIIQHGNSAYIKKFDQPRSSFKRLIWTKPGTEMFYAGEIDGKILFCQVGKAVIIDPEKPDEQNWIWINEDEKLNISYVRAIRDRIVACVIDGGSYKYHFYDGSGKLIKIIEPPNGSHYYFYPDKNKSEPKALVGESSFTHPGRYYLYDMETDVMELVKTPKPSIAFPEVEIRKALYKSKDGTMVPITVIHKEGLEKNRNNPTILYGYGGYGFVNTPRYSVMIKTFVDLGGVYAIAGIRGGGEFGNEWHMAGCRGNKQNSFDDFIAAGEWLVEEKYTDKEHLAILGGSNGGTLVGACLNLRPDLFAVAVAEVGLYDKLRYHKFSVGKIFTREGGCADNPEEFKWLYAYSPLHNVKKSTQYPSILIATNGHDNRCPPLHSFKFLAALQEAQAADKPVLLEYHEHGGHGTMSLDDRVDKISDTLTFIFANTGFDKEIR